MRLLRGRPDPVFRFVVRYSVLDHENPAWRLSSALDLERYRARLWDPRRLAVRTEIFLERALPLYQQMAGEHDVAVLVQHNPELPVLPELEAAARDHDVLRLVPMDRAEPMHETVHADLADHRSRGQAVLLRVDDDDLVAVDLLDQVAPFVTPEHQGWSVSLAQGLVARHDGRGLRDLRRMRRAFRSMGQAFIGGPARSAQPLWEPGNHMRVFEERPAIVHGRRLAWLQVLTEDQDSRTSGDRKADRESMLRTLRGLPQVTDEELERVVTSFPTLAADVERVREFRRRRRERRDREEDGGQEGAEDR